MSSPITTPTGASFEPLEIIGRGSFGQIRKVRRVSDGQILARKEISYQTMTPKEKSQLIAEFRILKSLNHPNIVQYLHHEHIPEEHMVHLYMEYCGGGDLSHVIKQCQQTNTLVPENVVWSVFTQLVLALFRCHYNIDPPAPDDPFCDSDCDLAPPVPDSFVLHRDIKPDNVFLDENYSVRLGDFGLAKMLDQDSLARTYVGTPYYMSPEILTDQPSTPHSDIWSLGCVMYELCALHPPFQAKTHLLLSQKIRQGVYPALPSFYSSTLSKTIAACLNLAPLHRPTTATLLRLDVIKLCRRERQVLERELTLQAAEDHLNMQRAMLAEQHNQMMQEIEVQRQNLEAEVYTKLQQEIEYEVDRRVALVLAEHNIKLSTEIEESVSSGSNTNSNRTKLTLFSSQRSPSDSAPSSASSIASVSTNITEPNTTPPLSAPSTRNVRGPRSLTSAATSANINPITPLRRFDTDIPSTTPSAWTTSLSNSRPAGMGLGAPMGVARNQNPISVPDSNKSSLLDESANSENMPSPFLKRWERRSVS